MGWSVQSFTDTSTLQNVFYTKTKEHDRIGTSNFDKLGGIQMFP